MLTESDHHGTPLDRRLSAQAVHLALSPHFEVNRAASELEAYSGGNRTALGRALSRLASGPDGRSSPVRQQAAAALRLALRGSHRQGRTEFLSTLEQETVQTFTALYGLDEGPTQSGRSLADA